MKPVLVLKQDGMAVQLGPIQVPLGQRDSNLFYNPGVTSLKPIESFYSPIDPETGIPIGPQALDIDVPKDAERLAQLGVNVDLAMTPERRRGTLRSRQEKYESKMPLQERIARNFSSQVDPTDKPGQEAAFQQAIDRTGLGANIGRYASYGLGGLAGLMALQRANESGTDLLSALGSAGTTGYLTQRQLQPNLQRLGMRGAGRTLTQPTSPSVGDSSLLTSTPTVVTPTGAGTKQGTFDVGIDDSIHLEGPTVSPPTTQTKPQTNLHGKILSPAEIMAAQNALGSGVAQHMAEPSHVSDEAMQDFEGTLSEEEQKTARMTLDDFGLKKSNRRSFVGVR